MKEAAVSLHESMLVTEGSEGVRPGQPMPPQVSSPSVPESASPDGRVISVWLLTNAPSPYQSELLSAIADRNDLELEVRFLQEGSPAGRSTARRYASRVVRSIVPRGFPVELHFHPRAVWECATHPSDCYVLSGLYTSITFLACAVILTLRRKPWLVWFERSRPQSRGDAFWSPKWMLSGPVRWLRNLVRGAVLRGAHRVICIGTAACDEYRECGVPDERLDMVPYCCDIDRYQAVDRESIAELRKQHDVAGHTVFLFSGLMVERKGVDTVLAAFADVASKRPEVALLLLGDGPSRDRYESMVPEAIRSRVHFTGHVPQGNLPAYFRAADVFVFPSRHDGWGVVINEACAASLPVVTTRQTGAARDLVDDGRTGFLIECDDVHGLVQAMLHLTDHPEVRATFGRNARQLVEQFSPERGAERFQHAIAAACQMRRVHR